MDLSEIYERFPTEKDCLAYLEEIRWRGEPSCPYCLSDRITPRPTERRHRCNNCNTAFSITVGTPFQHTHLPLQKWFVAISLILNARKDFSARRLTRELGINRNTAWYLVTRVRKAMLEPSQRQLMQRINSDLLGPTSSRTLGANV